MILTPYEIPSNRFDYDGDGHFAAFASELGHLRFDLVYDDACDYGFTMTSHRTGEKVVFAIHKLNQDAEGDVTHWDLISVGQPFNHRGNPTKHKGKFTVTIYND